MRLSAEGEWATLYSDPLGFTPPNSPTLITSNSSIPTLSAADPFDPLLSSSTPISRYLVRSGDSTVNITDTISIRSAPGIRRSASASHQPCPLVYAKQYAEESRLNHDRKGKDLQTQTRAVLHQKNLLNVSNNHAQVSSSISSQNRAHPVTVKGSREGYQLSMSSSTASFFDDGCMPLSRSKGSLSESMCHSSNKGVPKPSPLALRPRSLYVPFVGRVESPPLPPGKEARDILRALSFAPTQEHSLSYQHQNFNDAESCRSHPCLLYPFQKGSQSSLSSAGSNPSCKPRGDRSLYALPLPTKSFSYNKRLAAGPLSPKLPSIPSYETRQEEMPARSQLQSFVPCRVYPNTSVVNDTKRFVQPMQINQNVQKISMTPEHPNSTASRKHTSLSSSTADIALSPASSTSSPIPPLSPFVNAKRSYSYQSDLNSGREKQCDFESPIALEADPPMYSPTHPLNHSENTAIRVTHPPVLHPPPGLSSVLSPEKLLLTPKRGRGSLGNNHQRNKSASNISTHSQSSNSSSSIGLGSFETAKSSSSFSSVSSASAASNHMYQSHDSNPFATFQTSYSSSSLASNSSNTTSSSNEVFPRNYVPNDSVKLESIREASPYCPQISTVKPASPPPIPFATYQ